MIDCYWYKMDHQFFLEQLFQTVKMNANECTFTFFHRLDLSLNNKLLIYCKFHLITYKIFCQHYHRLRGCCQISNMSTLQDLWPFIQPLISQLFNNPPISVSALYLPLIPPLCSLCEMVGQAFRGSLTGHPMQLKWKQMFGVMLHKNAQTRDTSHLKVPCTPSFPCALLDLFSWGYGWLSCPMIRILK